MYPYTQNPQDKEEATHVKGLSKCFIRNGRTAGEHKVPLSTTGRERRKRQPRDAAAHLPRTYGSLNRRTRANAASPCAASAQSGLLRDETQAAPPPAPARPVRPGSARRNAKLGKRMFTAAAFVTAPNWQQPRALQLAEGRATGHSAARPRGTGTPQRRGKPGHDRPKVGTSGRKQRELLWGREREEGQAVNAGGGVPVPCLTAAGGLSVSVGPDLHATVNYTECRLLDARPGHRTRERTRSP